MARTCGRSPAICSSVDQIVRSGEPSSTKMISYSSGRPRKTSSMRAVNVSSAGLPKTGTTTDTNRRPFSIFSCTARTYTSGDRSMTKRVAILQSNYLPWKGYFDIIHDVDEFVFHDDLQYTKQDWRNRNRIKTPDGAAWLTIPVGDCEQRLICEVELPAGSWARDHWRKIEASYVRAPHFKRYRDLLRDALLGSEWRLLSDLNQHLIRLIAHDLLGLKTEFRDSRSLDLGDARKQE